jgi:transposase
MAIEPNRPSIGFAARLGIDVSKGKCDCALLDEASDKIVTKVVSNDAAGMLLLGWLDERLAKKSLTRSSVHAIAEPTSVYHELVAHTLYDQGIAVSLVNPARVSAFSQTIGQKSKTDRLDAALLARFGADRKPELWQPEPLAVRTLTALLARRAALSEDLVRERNRMEKVRHERDTPVEVLASHEQSRSFLEQLLKRLDQQIKDHIDSDPTLKANDLLLRSINGVGPKVAQRMNALLTGKRFESAAQAAAFAGLVPQEHESGNTKHPSRMSKRGDSSLRALLYMPAVVCICHNPHIKAQYARLLAKGKSKMSAIGAAMRKLVHLCFGVIHTRRPYDPHHVARA